MRIIIEGVSTVKDMDEKYIRIKGGVSTNCMICGIENSCGSNRRIISTIPQTTKKNTKIHGFGLQNVKRVLSKYNGELEIKSEGGIFKASIIIPLSRD